MSTPPDVWLGFNKCRLPDQVSQTLAHFLCSTWDHLGFHVSAGKKPFIEEDQKTQQIARVFFKLRFVWEAVSCCRGWSQICLLTEGEYIRPVTSSRCVHLGLLSLYMLNQLLQWCSAPPSCPLLLKTSVVRAVEEGKWQVAVWAQGAASPLYTAWFSHRTNWTHLCRTQALGSPCTPQGELTSLLAKCCLMLV